MTDSARRALAAVIARTAIVFRGIYCTVALPTAFALGPPAGNPLWRDLALVVIALWTVAVIVVCRRQLRLPPWVVLVDTALFSTFALASGQLLPHSLVGQGSTWVGASLSVSMLLLAWGLRRVPAIAAATVAVGAYIGGVALVGTPLFPAIGFLVLVYPIQLAIGMAVVLLMKRTALAADAALQLLTQTRQATLVDEARLTDADEQRLRLHDTVLTTLTAVARGGFVGRAELIRRRANMDLRQLGAHPTALRPADERTGALAAALGAEADVRGITLTHRELVDVAVPAEVAQAILASLREGLSNIERHAGVDVAELKLIVARNEIVVTLCDAGRGFTPRSDNGRSIGLRDSIQHRMNAVGGYARVNSSPGCGTTVTLAWPQRLAPTGDRLPDLFGHLLTDAYATGLARALTYVAVCWHVFTLVQLIPNLGAYQSPVAAVGAWLAFLGVGVWLLRQAPGSRVSARDGSIVLAVIVAASVTGILTCRGTGLFGVENWALGGFGWFLVAMAAHRPAKEIVVVWIFVPLVNVAAVYIALAGAIAPIGLTVNALGFVGVLQAGALLMYRILRRHGHHAAAALHALHELETERAARRAVSADRATRYRNLESTLLPLVRGIADGSVDPDSEAAQDQAWVAATVLRALLEHDVEAATPSTVDAVVAIASAAAGRAVAPELRIDDLDGLPSDAADALVAAMVALVALAEPGEATLVLRNRSDVATATVCMPSRSQIPGLLQVAQSARGMPLRLEGVPLGPNRVWLEAIWSR